MSRTLVGVGLLVACGAALAGYQALDSRDGSRSVRAIVQGAQVAFDRDLLDFGTTLVGVPARMSVVVTNQGDGALTLEAFDRQGAFTPLQGAVDLAAGAAAMLSFEFLPESAGDHRVRIAVRSDAGRLGGLELIGIGSSPPTIEIEPRTLDFGPVAVGGERTAPLKISNLGGGPLTVSSLAGIGRFSVAETSLEIPAGEHAVVQVSFAPQRLGPSRAQLRVRSDDPERGDLAIGVKGRGVEYALAPAIEITPSVLAFGKVAPGKSKRSWVEIRNLSSDPLTITSVLVDGPFRIATRSREIAPRGFVKLPVILTPQEPETEVRGTLSIFSNDPSSGTVAVAVNAVVTGLAEADRAPERSGTLIGTVFEALRGEAAGEGGSGAAAPAATSADAVGVGAEGPDAVDPATPVAESFFDVEDGSYLNLASYQESVSSPNMEGAVYDAQAGTVTLQGLQLPEVDAALGEYFTFAKTDVVATVSDAGEVSATVPVEIFDEFGNGTVVDVHFTTETAVAIIDGTEIALAGSPLVGGEMTLVALERVPGGTLEGHSLQLNLNVRVE